MIEIIKNLSDYNITVDNAYAYLMHGEDAVDHVRDIVRVNLQGKCIVFKASGMLDNVSVTKDYAGELVYFEEGDASKFFVKKYPEILMSFSTDDQLERILDDWVCTCYERRILYFVDINNFQSLIDLLLEFKFDTSICYNKIWPLVDCIIENDPESPEHDTFVLITKRDLIPIRIGGKNAKA